MAKIPAYKEMYRTLKREILEGEYSVGELLPTETRLGVRFQASRTTVRRAMNMLAQEGFVRMKQGYGTVVLDCKARQKMNRITSVSETLQKKGHHVTARRIEADIRPASLHIAKMLGIREDTPVVRLQRLVDMDGKPLAIMKNYIPVALVPGIENSLKEIPSLYQYLEDRYGIIIQAAQDNYSARNASAEEAELLDVPEGTALLYLRRVCYTENGPVTVDRVLVLGDRYEVELSMTGREKN